MKGWNGLTYRKGILNIDMESFCRLANDQKNAEISLKPKSHRGGEIVDPVVRYLVDNGARVGDKDKYGLTPLHYSAMRGQIPSCSHFAAELGAHLKIL